MPLHHRLLIFGIRAAYKYQGLWNQLEVWDRTHPLKMKFVEVKMSKSTFVDRPRNAPIKPRFFPWATIENDPWAQDSHRNLPSAGNINQIQDSTHTPRSLWDEFTMWAAAKPTQSSILGTPIIQNERHGTSVVGWLNVQNTQFTPKNGQRLPYLISSDYSNATQPWP